MGRGKTAVMDARSERRAILALAVLFALLVQTLIPSLAHAAPGARDTGVICSATGLHGGAAGGAPAGNHMAGGGCDHCVCPVVAATPQSAAAMGDDAVRYAVRVERAGLGGETCAPGRGLAAPPPPSRGPPV
jgi:hypothetical protein